MSRPTDEQKTASTNPVRSVERALKILMLAAESSEPLGLTEISKGTEIDKATALRLLATLESFDLITRDPVTRRYTVGSGVWRLASAWRGDLRSVSQRHLDQLRQITGESVSLICPRGYERVVVLALEAMHELCVVPTVGSAVPIYAGASGKVLMAHLPEAERDRIIDLTGLKPVQPDRIIDRRSFLESLEAVRRRGYGVSVGDVTLGATAIAAPIFNAAGEVEAVVSLRAPEIRLTEERTKQVAPLVVDCAMAISRDIGFSPVEARRA
jgi:DNA-binding IclR family transcriptional regulator